MSNRNVFQALQSAGGAGGAGLDVNEVFSTYLYTGTGSAQTITNGLDLDGEGGLVWIKDRSSSTNHSLVDSERGVDYWLRANTTDAQISFSGNSLSPMSFNSNGFTTSDYGEQGYSGNDFASWSFLKSKRFFDIQTWTGDGTNNRKIPHNLGSVPGCYFVKQVNDGRGWSAYHRGVNGGTNPEQYVMNPADTDAQNDVDYWNDTAPTSTEFTINNYAPINESGGTYVAYLWAHNDGGDGEFGQDSSQDIIKCGSYTGNGSATGPSVNLGFEPQWLLIRNVDRVDDWVLIDAMRGIPSSSDGPAVLRPETNAPEKPSGSGFSQASRVDLTATGFDVKSSNSRVNGSSQNMIYIAIRRGPLAPPESATDVFDVNLTTSNQFVTTGFPVDLQIGQYTGGGENYIVDRMRGMSTSTTGSMKYMLTRSTGAEASNTGSLGFNGFVQNGFSHTLGNFEQALWSWKRAPSYMDCVAYVGNSTAGRTVEHGLTVPPEMMWVKQRPYSSAWAVYHKDIGAANKLILNSSSGTVSATSAWNSTAPTSSVFTLGSLNDVNESPLDHIAILFASLDGISKVGSFTHTSGSDTNVDCGFSSGARFVLVKRTDGSSDFMVWDTERGIVSGNDPFLKLNNSQAERTNTDYIDPLASGFTITSNLISGNYIFYAIA